jgi:hypothetical protein
MKPNLTKLLTKKFDPCKKYKVYIEMSGRNSEGYIFMHPKAVDEKSNSNFFIMTFSFRKMGDKRNPLFNVERLEGMDFEDRIEVINHFAKHNALTYCVKQDGIDKL